nr:FKBP-type peptidyl-prolyl cis-trans isomerase [Kordiimonas aquimaris]
MNQQEAEELAKEQQAEAEAQQQAFRQSQLDYLAENLKNDDIKVTDSGLQYRVIEEGTGQSPTATSNVTVHYSGKLTNGEEFDSSYKRGETIQFPLNGVIKGWTEGVQLMKEGGKYEFFLPYDLGYGERGTPSGIPPYATLIFIVELVSVDS